MAKDYELKVTVQNVMNRRELVTLRRPNPPFPPNSLCPLPNGPVELLIHRPMKDGLPDRGVSCVADGRPLPGGLEPSASTSPSLQMDPKGISLTGPQTLRS